MVPAPAHLPAGLYGYAIGSALAFALFTWLALVVATPVLFLLLGAIPLTLSSCRSASRRSFEQAPRGGGLRVLVTAAHLLAGVSGPLLDVFFVRAELDRFEVIATKAVTQTAGHAVKILYFGWLVPTAPLERELPLWLYPVLVAARTSARKAGGRILEAFTDASFRRWTGRVVIALSLLYVWRGATGLGLPAPW